MNTSNQKLDDLAQYSKSLKVDELDYQPLTCELDDVFNTLDTDMLDIFKGTQKDKTNKNTMTRKEIITCVQNLLVSSGEPKEVMSIMIQIGGTTTGYSSLPTICKKILGKLGTQQFKAFFFCLEVIVVHLQNCFTEKIHSPLITQLNDLRNKKMSPAVKKLFNDCYLKDKALHNSLTENQYFAMFNFHNFRLISDTFTVKSFLNGKINTQKLFQNRLISGIPTKESYSQENGVYCVPEIWVIKELLSEKDQLLFGDDAKWENWLQASYAAILWPLFKRVGKNGRPNQSKINLLTNLVTKQINISYWYRSQYRTEMIKLIEGTNQDLKDFLSVRISFAVDLYDKGQGKIDENKLLSKLGGLDKIDNKQYD